MKRLLVTIIGALALGAALPAMAGPDWNVIERTRQEKRQAVLAQSGQASKSGQSASGQDCPPPSLVHPNAYGPRAITAPALIQERKSRHEARVKACQEAPR